MDNESDLYAQLPLGASGLKAELGGGTRLSFKYVAVGVRATEITPILPDSGCDDATHYIRAITVGAYELDSEASANASVGVDLQIASAGAYRREGAHRLRSSGDLTGCSEQSGSRDAESMDSACLAPLQLTLVPLHRARAQATTSDHEAVPMQDPSSGHSHKATGGTCVRSPQASDTEALRLVDRAINEDFIGAQIGDAEDKLEQALQSCINVTPPACSCQVLGKIFVAKASLTAFGRGDMVAAKQDLTNAFKVDPDVQPIDGLDRPDFQQAWDSARRKVRGR